VGDATGSMETRPNLPLSIFTRSSTALQFWLSACSTAALATSARTPTATLTVSLLLVSNKMISDFDDLLAHEAAAAHDEFSAAALVRAQVEFDPRSIMPCLRLRTLRISIWTAAASVPNCAAFWTRSATRAPQFVLGRQAGDGGARTADPAALHGGDLFAGMAPDAMRAASALAAAEDYDIKCSV
jgi:hypothetical protein